MMKMWNPWHGCHKISEGCLNCYMHRGDAKRGIDSSIIEQTQNFDLPIQRKKRSGDYKIPSSTEIATCFTSDFFLEEADEWRTEAWKMIRERQDLHFLMLTKRIDRFHIALPNDWGDGYNNVTIGATVENQKRADHRLPIFKELPIKHKLIICSPLLEYIDLDEYLGSWVDEVVVTGESGYNVARACNYDWILKIRNTCIQANVSFTFRQTGSKLMKDGKLHTISRWHEFSQARKAGINFKRKKGTFK